MLELFAGIGACSKALTNLGIDHEIVDAVEIDKYAIASFNAVHGTKFEPQDIREWDKDIEADLIIHGSPCQDFSIAGKNAGGDEGSGTRSSLLYESLRIIENVKPKYVIWENVKNLLSKKHVHNWEQYCNKMNELGYNNWCKVLNAKDYGVPQNRERVFTVSIRKDINDNEFIFPARRPLTKRLKDVLEDNVDEKYYLSDQQTHGLKFSNPDVAYCLDANYAKGTNVDQYLAKKRQQIVKVGDLDIKGNDQIKRVYGAEGVSPTLSTMEGGNRQPKIVEDFRIRKLTPKECWRLMGFDDVDFDKAAKVNSNSQLYKQAGNSIVVDVLEAILKELFRIT